MLDNRLQKVNLGVGVYCNDDGQIPLLDCVIEAEGQLVAQKKPRNYLPIDGLTEYNLAVQKLLFGPTHTAVLNKRIATIQGIAGSGCLRVGADFLKQTFPQTEVYISQPSWSNHQSIFKQAGFTVKYYPYYDPSTKGIDLSAMLKAIKDAPGRSIFVLQACCHNPTGVDLTAKQWDEIIQVLQTKEHIVFLDIAYQGFGHGLVEDAQAIRKCVDAGLNGLVASSFSKIMGLYGERVGALSAICASEDEAQRVKSQLKNVVRGNYSSPPSHGGQIAEQILTTPTLYAKWQQELTMMRERIQNMRASLITGLKGIGVEDNLQPIATQVGMFSYLGLSADKMLKLRQDFGIYGTNTSRICVAALNRHNIDYVCQSVRQVW